MYNIAVVDDDVEFSTLLNEYLERFQKEEKVKFFVKTFNNAVDLLTGYKPNYNVILMDIEMPLFNGLEAAREIRMVDEAVSIIFVTNMGQFAINGYEVNAIDFIVKPIQYYNFALKLKKAIAIQARRETEDVVLNTAEGMVRLAIKDIEYIENDKHYLIYHVKGKTYKERGTMREAEQKLHKYGFLRCNNCLLVNYRFVTVYNDSTVFIGEEGLPISRPRKRAFINELICCLGGGI